MNVHDLHKTGINYYNNIIIITTVALHLSNAWACAQVETDSKL